ncbi:MAG: hypothetical protein WBA74_07680 [Cyclobacteriaceae bacterium]
MNKLLLVFFFVLSSSVIMAQTDSTTLLAHIDEVTKSWDKLSEDLSTYEGLKMYCKNKTFQNDVLSSLNSIHHYDTVVYNILVKKNRFKKDKEIEQTLKEIKKFEVNYHPSKLRKFLHEECVYRYDIEKEKKDSKNDLGSESYDGQITLLEAELYKYVKHITKLVDHLRKHAHHLHLEKYEDG